VKSVKEEIIPLQRIHEIKVVEFHIKNTANGVISALFTKRKGKMRLGE